MYYITESFEKFVLKCEFEKFLKIRSFYKRNVVFLNLLRKKCFKRV